MNLFWHVRVYSDMKQTSAEFSSLKFEYHVYSEPS